MQYRLTKPARQAVEYARNVAEELGHSYVGTEHLMIGLIRAYDGMASAILTQNGVSEDGLLADFLSTALYMLGSQTVMDNLNRSEFSVIAVTEEGRILISDDLKEHFILKEETGYTMAS